MTPASGYAMLRGWDSFLCSAADAFRLRLMAQAYAEWEFYETMLAVWLQGMANFGSLSGLALPVIFFVALYFLMIAPNQKKQKKWQEMLGQLKTGDKVTTNGGIKGTVLTVKDDAVVLRILPDGVKLEFVKSAIASVTRPDAA